AAENQSIAFAVFKPTALVFPEILKLKGFDKKTLSVVQQYHFEKFVDRIDSLCNLAYQKSVRLLIDAEDVWYQDAVDEVVEDMMRKYNQKRAIVWNTWQMYRTDRLDHLKLTLEKARSENFHVGAKLVRGAYMEKERKRAQKGGYPSPIFPDKPSTDKSYNQALQICVENIDICELFNGTHNEESCLKLLEYMNQKGLKNSDPRIWTSQLYGMSDHISYNMAAEGYNVAKYIPYGPVRSVAPYLLRRAEENSAIRGQTTRELNLIMQEMKQRKQRS
ncbi:MAG TPA: proline dehydrogenase family protein, partial [Salinivirgaceae bacterium]|nr:proline dehydrogenase family protein [Salinivirgaceae bacterium]